MLRNIVHLDEKEKYVKAYRVAVRPLDNLEISRPFKTIEIRKVSCFQNSKTIADKIRYTEEIHTHLENEVIPFRASKI